MTFYKPDLLSSFRACLVQVLAACFRPRIEAFKSAYCLCLPLIPDDAFDVSGSFRDVDAVRVQLVRDANLGMP